MKKKDGYFKISKNERKIVIANLKYERNSEKLNWLEKTIIEIA
jgi:hypothetical protein